MALQETKIHVGFRGGVETQSDPKAVPPTQLLVLENGVFTRGTSIGKRNGYEALSLARDGSEEALTGLARMAARDDEVIAFTSNTSHSHEATAAQWDDAGAVFSVLGSDRPVVRTGTQQTMPDQATNLGVTVYAWEDSRGGVWYTVADALTGRIHRAPTQADADGISPRCCPVGDVLHIYWVTESLNRISVIVVSPAAPAADVTAAILTSDLNAANAVYDVCATPATWDGVEKPAVIAWPRVSTNDYRLGLVDASGTLGTPLLGLPSVVTRSNGMAAASPIAVTASGTYTVTVASQPFGTTSAVVAIFTATALIEFVSAVTVLAVTDPQRMAVAATSDTIWVAVEEDAAEASNRYVTIGSVNVNTAAITTRVQRSVGLASRAWAIDDDAFAYFVHDTTFFNVYLALRLEDSICVARTLPGLAAGAPPRAHLSSAHVVDDVVSVALPYRERLVSENADQFTETGIRGITLAFNADDSHQAAQLGRGLYLAGACWQHYDGRAWDEQGFHFGPELIDTINGSSGAMTDDTTYLYRVWYEWTDAQGEVHRGPVSPGTTVTLAIAEDEVTLTLPTLRVTAKANVRICVGRSKAAETGDTAEMFRVTSSDPSAGGPNGYVANDPTVDTATFVDRMSDTDLAEQEPIYTTGGILSNDPCPLGNIVAVGKSRLFTSDPADPYGIRYSQPIEDGYGVEFAPELVLKCDPFGGAVVGLAVLDTDVIVFQERTIRAFNGEGPLPTGDASTSAFTGLRQLQSDVGCSAPASIVAIPGAVAFSSDQGIHVVDRSGQVLYVGAPVEGYNAQRITAATRLPGRSSVVFLTDDGITLNYDYQWQQWSTFTNHLGLAAVVAGGAYYYLRTTGTVYREAIGAYADDGIQVRMRLETAWIHIAQAIQGFQRFYDLRLIGTWYSPHQLVIQSQVDYQGEGWSDASYLDATGESAGSTGWVTGSGANTIGEDPLSGSDYSDGEYDVGEYGGTQPDIYQWRYHIGGRGQSVRFRIEDFQRVGLAGASFELTEALITGGIAGPAVKPVAAARSR